MTRMLVTVGNALDLPGYPVSAAAATDGVVFTAGVIAIDPDTGELVRGDVATQTHQVLDNLEAILRAGGSGMGDLLFVDVLLRHAQRDFTAFNDVYEMRVADPPPRRTSGAELALPQLLIEISAVAARPLATSAS